MKTLARAAPPASLAIGLELRASRLKAKFGVRELARRAAVNPSQVSSWELGERVPPPDYVSFLAGLLQLPIAELRRLRQLAADACRENHVEAEPGAAERLTAAYNQLASRIVEWTPTTLPDRLRCPGSTRERRQEASMRIGREPQPDDAEPIRDLFVGTETVRARNEDLRWLLRAGRERIRMVTVEPEDLPAFTVYHIHGKTPTVELRHGNCSVYLTSELATAPYVRAVRSFTAEALSPAETAHAITTAPRDLSRYRPSAKAVGA